MQTYLELLQRKIPELPVPEVLATRMFVALGRCVSSLFEQQIRPYGLADLEFRVLTALFTQAEGSAHPSDLCARTGQSPANISRSSDVLVERGLITRVSSEEDRRKMVLHITAAGEALVRRLLPTLFEPMLAVFDGIPETEQVALIGHLKRIAENLDAAMRAPQHPAGASDTTE